MPPVLVLGALVASMHAFFFHALVARQREGALLYWGAGLVGFGLGHLIGEVAGTSFLMVGDVHLVEGTLGAWLLLSALNARWS